MKTNDLNELIEKLVQDSFNRGFIDGWTCKESIQDVKNITFHMFNSYMQNYYLKYIKKLTFEYSFKQLGEKNE